MTGSVMQPLLVRSGKTANNAIPVKALDGLMKIPASWRDSFFDSFWFFQNPPLLCLVVCVVTIGPRVVATARTGSSESGMVCPESRTAAPPRRAGACGSDGAPCAY